MKGMNLYISLLIIYFKDNFEMYSDLAVANWSAWCRLEKSHIQCTKAVIIKACVLATIFLYRNYSIQYWTSFSKISGHSKFQTNAPLKQLFWYLNFLAPFCVRYVMHGLHCNLMFVLSSIISGIL
jgi:phosphate starvation-inducible membrane PsiE